MHELSGWEPKLLSHKQTNRQIITTLTHRHRHIQTDYTYSQLQPQTHKQKHYPYTHPQTDRHTDRQRKIKMHYYSLLH